MGKVPFDANAVFNYRWTPWSFIHTVLKSHMKTKFKVSKTFIHTRKDITPSTMASWTNGERLSNARLRTTKKKSARRSRGSNLCSRSMGKNYSNNSSLKIKWRNSSLIKRGLSLKTCRIIYNWRLILSSLKGSKWAKCKTT